VHRVGQGTGRGRASGRSGGHTAGQGGRRPCGVLRPTRARTDPGRPVAPTAAVSTAAPAMTSRRPRILFVAEAVTLAHVARPMMLAQRLDPARYDVSLATDGRYD